MKNLPFNLCIAFLACFLMNFVTPAFSSPTPSPTITSTPTPELEPTPLIEYPERIAIFPTSLKLKKRQSSEVIATLLGADGMIFYDETITAIINKSGSKRISISPTSASTGENGQVKFTITAKNKTGYARVTFQAGNIKKSITVKVRR